MFSIAAATSGVRRLDTVFLAHRAGISQKKKKVSTLFCHSI
jgi:hypothetical protein